MKISIKRLTSVLGVSGILLLCFVLGVSSARRENFAYKLYQSLYEKKQLFAFQREGTEWTDQKGIWQKIRKSESDTTLSSARAKALENLSALPYLKGYNSAPDEKNITIYNRDAAYDGLNFVLSADGPHSFIMDMEGVILHQWRIDFEDVWPESYQVEGVPAIKKDYWKRSRLLADGNILAIFTDYGLVKLDKDSNPVWAYKGRCHHDMLETASGDILVLTRERRVRNDLQMESAVLQQPILEDFITTLNADGEELNKISVIDCFLNSDYASVLEHIKITGDMLHTNTIRVIDGRLAGSYPMFKKGHYLISMRDIHTVAVVDPEAEKITWAISGLWKFQHEPRLLDNGNILLFDNRGYRGKSRAIEFEPLSQRIIWEYKGDPPKSFFSRRAGSLERLPNGNTLITESEYGRAFEVNPAGDIVWEFLNPFRAGKNMELIAALYDVVRYETGELDWLMPDADQQNTGGL